MIERHQHYRDGSWVHPHGTQKHIVVNPASEERCAEVILANEADVDAAVSAARRSFLDWSTASKKDRLGLLRALLSEYQKRSNELGEVISMELGAPIEMARKLQAKLGSWRISAFIDAFESMDLETAVRPSSGTELNVREPVGVCALITPWNWPMNQITLKVVPALTMGCTVVLKPSELTPLSAMLFSEIVDAAGFPAGVYNQINGIGEEAGRFLTSHPDVDMISFTGSTRAGIAISKSAADTVKRVTLELGGKGANIVFSDAGEQAVQKGVASCFHNTGQSCNAPTRMLVERDYYEEAVEIAADTANKIAVGQPCDSGDHIGPVIGQQQYDRVQEFLEQALLEGAQIVAGGLGKPTGFEKGYFVRPTVLRDVENRMAIAQEEVFGPVLCMIPFDDEHDAIRLANDTIYGLTNYVQTLDLAKAERVARQLRSGMVSINGARQSLGSPFGGYKRSGIGREGGIAGLEEFTEIKNICGLLG